MGPTDELTQIARKYHFYSCKVPIRPWYGQGHINDILSFKLPAHGIKMFWTYFCSDYDLNTVCNGICTEENSKCITICDSTDSECINGCRRAEVSCLESKFCNTNIISYQLISYYMIHISYMIYMPAIFQNFVKVAPATKTVPMVVTDAKTPFANARWVHG